MENHCVSISDQQDNCFLIDWLTFVCHGDSVDNLKRVLGLDSADIPWETEEKFRNGYPIQCYWNGITISYGAEEERYYKDPSKARHDMGICVNLSGKGCRCFESYGRGDWFELYQYIFRDIDYDLAPEMMWQDRKRINITRLDLAYDDHIGLIDIYLLESYTRDRCYVSKAKYSEILWSDNQDTDIQGLTLNFGSSSSAVKIRIYDKAAERCFKDRHWVRCEMQLRDDRAYGAAILIRDSKHIGSVASGILRNYLTFRIPSSDSNKSRWPILESWEFMLENMEKISVWISPGEPYNFDNTERWILKQYGQALVVSQIIHDHEFLYDMANKLYPTLDELSPKYKKFLANLEIKHKPFDYLPPEPGFVPSLIWGDQAQMEGF